MASIEQVNQAAEILKGVALETPLVYSNYFSRRFDSRIYLKLENLQKTGSFKFRGAYHKLARTADTLGPGGVLAASAGNHAQGVAHAAQLMSVSSSIVMPEWASISKQVATRSYGGKVILAGKSLGESLSEAHKLEAEGRVFIHPYDDGDIIAGQGTVGLEIVSQLPEVEAILVPVGGGGLIAKLLIQVGEEREQAGQPPRRKRAIDRRAETAMRTAVDASFPVPGARDGGAVKLPPDQPSFQQVANHQAPPVI